MNFSGISDKTLLGRTLRLPLRLVPPDAKVVVLQGRLRGYKWVAGSSNHGCWLGSYEYEKCKAFEEAVSKDAVVFDLGANVGFYTLLASALTGPGGRVIAFEPLPRNLSYLRRHLTLNGVTNVTVVDAAVSDRCGTASFEEGPTNSMGHVGAQGPLQVQAVSLDEMVLTGKIPPPAVVKIDVEGAEGLVLKGARDVLSTYHPVIFLAAHSPELNRDCSGVLRSLGYALGQVPGLGAERDEEIIAVCRQ